jgi:hypothetical protein
LLCARAELHSHREHADDCGERRPQNGPAFPRGPFTVLAPGISAPPSNLVPQEPQGCPWAHCVSVSFHPPPNAL